MSTEVYCDDDYEDKQGLEDYCAKVGEYIRSLIEKHGEALVQDAIDIEDEVRELLETKGDAGIIAEMIRFEKERIALEMLEQKGEDDE